MLRLVSNVRPEVAADDAVPRRLVLLVEFLLDESGNILYTYITIETKKNKAATTTTENEFPGNLFISQLRFSFLFQENNAYGSKRS